MKLVKTIANLGYGSRKEVTAMFREGRITDAAGDVLYADDVATTPCASTAWRSILRRACC